jgi:hypothetical protein
MLGIFAKLCETHLSDHVSSLLLSLCKWALPIILNSPPQSPPWPDPYLGAAPVAAARPLLSSQCRPPLAEVGAAHPWPRSASPTPGRARCCPHVLELAHARAYSISPRLPLTHLSVAELAGACTALRSRLPALALAGADRVGPTRVGWVVGQLHP